MNRDQLVRKALDARVHGGTHHLCMSFVRFALKRIDMVLMEITRAVSNDYRIVP